MQVSKEGIERIRSANPIEAVLAERGLVLKRKGKSLFALCPFHSEKTPSFSLSPGKGLYKCFGCGASGDVIGFVVKHDRVSFPEALEVLARRAGLDLQRLMEARPRRLGASMPIELLTPPPELAGRGARGSATTALAPTEGAPPPPAPGLFGRVVEHYHSRLLDHASARQYLERRGLTDRDLWRVCKIGYADGSLLELAGRGTETWEQLVALGLVTKEGRELLGGCIVVPLADPGSGAWVNLYGRGIRTDRHCYLPGPHRGLFNYQAARSASEVVLVESVIDALSFLQVGIASALPIYGTSGFTSSHLDLLLKSASRRVVLCLDNDDAGKKASRALEEKLASAGIAVRVASLPAGIKDPNELLVSLNGDAGEAMRAVLAPPPPLLDHDLVRAPSVSGAESISPGAEASAPTARIETRPDGLLVRLQTRTYHAKAMNLAITDRLRVVLRVEEGGRFLVDALDLYAARSRREYARRAAARLGAPAPAIEEELLGLVTHIEAYREEQQRKEAEQTPAPPEMTTGERADARAFLERKDLLDQVGRDIDALGYVGETTLMRLLYLIAISRKLDDPCSGIVLSQSGAGKSGATEVIERLTPPEDVVLLTRLTPQSLYYVAPGFLDKKLVIVEERYGSMDADYSIRVLQSRKKLIAAAPVKDPQTGNMRTKVFTVEARAAFIEATTASAVNHENATRCFELTMDESAEQTRRIHERQRLMRTERGLELRQQAEAITRLHWNAQRLLEALPVVIPFAHLLTFPDAWMRTRRDHARFLNLIEVSAFLHQYQRERRGGAIVASLADYEIAYHLAGEVLLDTLSDLKKPLREAYERVRTLCESNGGTVSRRQIREALNEPDSTVRRWLMDLVELEYLSVAESSKGGPGRAVRYQLVDHAARSSAPLGLLTPAELLARLG